MWSGLAVRLYRKWVLQRPRTWLFIIVAISLLAGFHARDFHLDASTDSLVMQNDPSLEYYRQVANRYGGSGDILIATYTPDQGDLFNRTTLDPSVAWKHSWQRCPTWHQLTHCWMCRCCSVRHKAFSNWLAAAHTRFVIPMSTRPLLAPNSPKPIRSTRIS